MVALVIILNIVIMFALRLVAGSPALAARYPHAPGPSCPAGPEQGLFQL